MFSCVDGVGPSQIQYAFGMCKMTQANERDKKMSPSYTELEHVEFLEMIGRIAHTRFQGSELQDQIDLASKIEYVLDDLFPLIQMERSEREEEDGFDSDTNLSDDY